MNLGCCTGAGDGRLKQDGLALREEMNLGAEGMRSQCALSEEVQPFTPSGHKLTNPHSQTSCLGGGGVEAPLKSLQNVAVGKLSAGKCAWKPQVISEPAERR